MLEGSPGKLLLPHPDGRIYEDTIRWQLVDHLRRALVKIGDIIGWDHTCRRCKRKASLRSNTVGEGAARDVTASQDADAVFTLCHGDGGQRQSPACGMRLWASAVPRPVRFYDLRHTSATIMRSGGAVDLGGVQKTLGHSSPEITAGIYDHSEIEGHREAIERALTFNPGPVTEPEPPSPSATTSGPVAHAVTSAASNS